MGDLDELGQYAQRSHASPRRIPKAKTGNGNLLFGIGAGVVVMLFLVFVAARSRGPAVASESITAEQLVGDYLANEVRGDAAYKGRTIEVRGFVVSIHRDITNQAYVTFRSPFPLRRVQCFFPRENEPALATLGEGDAVAIVGRCDGLFGNVLIRDCRLENVH